MNLKMHLNDLKIYLINASAFLFTFSSLDEILKNILVFSTIIYTAVKTINEWRNRKK